MLGLKLRYFSKKGPSHYHYWTAVNEAQGLYFNEILFELENAFEHVICKMAPFLTQQ